MAGGGFAGESRKKTTTFTAKFVDPKSKASHIIPWTVSKPLEELKATLATTFGHPNVALMDPETGHGINSDPEMRLMLEEWNEREGVRKQDMLESWILHLQTLLSDAETLERGVHGLWELACRPVNHAEISMQIVGELMGVISRACREPQFHRQHHHHSGMGEAKAEGRGEELRVGAMAAAAVWMLAEVESTRARMHADQYVPVLLEFAHRAAASKFNTDMAMQPIGALSTLLRVPAGLRAFSEMQGEALLLALLRSDSAQVRRVASAGLFAACSASVHTCVRVATSGGTISLAELALTKTEAVAVRACSLLTLGCVVQNATEARIAPQGTMKGLGFFRALAGASTSNAASPVPLPTDLPPSLLERLTAAASELLHTIEMAAADKVAAEKAATEGRSSPGPDSPTGGGGGGGGGGGKPAAHSVDATAAVGLLASTLSAMWNLLAYSFTAGKLLKKEQMKVAALLLKRVLDVGAAFSDSFICPACGALNNLPPSALPSGLAPILSRLLPAAEGRTLEAIATLLAALMGSKLECNSFIGCRGVLVVLERCEALVATAHVESYRNSQVHLGDQEKVGRPSHETPTALKASAMRAHAALSYVLMAATAHAAQLEAGEARARQAEQDNPGNPAAGRDHGVGGGGALAGGGGDGGATETEKLEEWVAKLDQDGDGEVDRGELLAVILESGGTEEQCDAIWAKLDFDGDGSLTVQEIAAALKVRQLLFDFEHIPALIALSCTVQPRALAYNMATLWTLATFGKMRAPLGKAGAVETAIHALRRALDGMGPATRGGTGTAPTGAAREAADKDRANETPAQRAWWLRLAQWSCAAIWLLSYDDENAHRTLKGAGELLVALAADAEPVLQTMAMGAVVRLIMLPTTMATTLHEYGAVDVLLRVGQTTQSNPQLRLMCSTTLSFLCNFDGAKTPEQVSAEARDIATRLEDISGLERMLVALVRAHGRAGLQTVGCRRLALVSMQSLKKCRVVLQLGGTAAVLDLLRIVHPGKAGKDADGKDVVEKPKPGQSKLWCLTRPELLRCAINALLNLSIEPQNQVWLATHGLPNLIELVCEPAMQSRRHEWVMLARLLENLSSNNENRRRLYRAELVMRNLQFQHMTDPEEFAAATAAAAAAAPPAPAKAEKAKGGVDPFGSMDNMLQKLADSDKDETVVKREEKVDPKVQYLSWLTDLLEADSDDEGGERDAVHNRLFYGDPNEAMGRGAAAAARRHRQERADRLQTKAAQRAAGKADADEHPLAARTLPQLMCRPLASVWREQLEEFQQPASPDPHASAVSVSARPTAAGAARSVPPTKLPALKGASSAPGGVRASGADAAGGSSTDAAGTSPRRRSGAEAKPPARLGRERTAAKALTKSNANLLQKAGLKAQPGLPPPPGPGLLTGGPGGEGEDEDEDYGEEEEEEDYCDPWNPAIERIEVQKKRASIDATGARKGGRRRRSGRAAPSFTVKIDAAPFQGEGIRNFKFSAKTGPITAAQAAAMAEAAEKAAKEKRRAKMIAWRGVNGSRYAKQLFPAFPMPDGKGVLHFNYVSQSLHSEHPGAEPGEQEPLLLSDIQQEALPPPVAPYRPTGRDQPMLRHFIYLGAPPPARHTLDIGEHVDVWFGTVPNEMLTLHVKRKEDIGDLLYPGMLGQQGKSGSTVKVRSWDIDKSIWKPRKSYADARSFWDTPAVYKRGMNIDWARCCTDRFKKAVLPFRPADDPIRTDRELARLKAVLNTHRVELYSCFAYYAIVGSGPHDKHGMWKNEAFELFCEECQISVTQDGQQVAAANSDLHNIFLVACMDVPKSDPIKDRGSSNTNDTPVGDTREGKGHALLRYGFVAVVVRLSVAKYRDEAAVSPAWAVERMISECILPNLPASATVVTDDFRNWKLYGPDVEDIFRRYIASLRAMFKFYSGQDYDGISAKGELLSLEEFTRLLLDADVFDNELGRREAALCFCWSQMFVADEVKRREKLLNLTFEGFLEALARLTCFKALPTASQLVERRVSTVSEYFDKLDDDNGFNDWAESNVPSWKKEETEGRQLEEVLEKLLQFMINRLDVDESGTVTNKDFTNTLAASRLSEKHPNRTKRQSLTRAAVAVFLRADAIT